MSEYIAEFWNVVTNGIFVSLAALGIYHAIQNRQGKRVIACFVGQLMVGCGSACFHATLKYSTQMLDELPMLYCCGAALYAIVEIDTKIKYGWTLAAALVGFHAAITLIYLFWMQNPIFHQVAFALDCIAGVVMGYRRQKEMFVCEQTNNTLNRLLVRGVLGMLGGFTIWNLDNVFCNQLRTYRGHVGAPFDVLLQFHGWWHIFTAFGSSYLLLWVHLTRLAKLKHDHLFTVDHKFGLLPYISLKPAKHID